MKIWSEVTESYRYGRLIPKLKCVIRYQPMKFSNPQGPMGRLKMLRSTVTALFKLERIETNLPKAIEARGYAERLITDAIRYGDCHRPTMEMADFWIEEKQIVHKLFKVLAPRYSTYDGGFTRMHAIPIMSYEEAGIRGIRKKALLELKGNPFPPVVPIKVPLNLQLHNILLAAAKREMENETYFAKPEMDDDIPLSQLVIEDKHLTETDEPVKQ